MSGFLYQLLHLVVVDYLLYILPFVCLFISPLVAPSPFPSKIPKNATRTVGESVTFLCDFDGIPKPTVTWFHDNGTAWVQVKSAARIVLTSTSLEIRRITKKDEGKYICRGNNSAGSSQVFAYLKVQGENNLLTSQKGRSAFRG